MLELLGRDVAVADLPPSEADWYLNLLWLDRRKCLLLTHAGTLFSVFVADVHAAQLRPLSPYLVETVEAELRKEQLPADAFGPLARDTVLLAKTASRSVLGFMNDLAEHVRYAVASAGGLSRCDIDIVNQHLRRTPYNRGGYVYPIDLVAQRLGTGA